MSEEVLELQRQHTPKSCRVSTFAEIKNPEIHDTISKLESGTWLQFALECR
jgi:hypothetical protein